MMSDVATAMQSAPVAPEEQPVQSGLPVRDLLLVVVQLVLLCTVVWQFHIDESHYLLTLLVAGTIGFAVHARLPAAAGQAWLIALSLGCLVLVLGWTDAALVGSVAVLLIGIAWCPLSLMLRSLLLIACGAALFMLRGESERLFWPVVGSMFMFRMLIYVIESRRFQERPSLLMTAGYFLMLPNVFYPLFPVVDFRTFRDTADRQKRRETYQSGVHWMFLGVAQLLLYRVINTQLLPAPYEVRTTRDVAQYLAMNYGLYVRISGQFHLVVGILHLFGFNLPRTHDNYFLASSFTDIWRRINIYWKDFLSTFVFFPAFFRLRRLGDILAVPLAVLCVFVATWLGHSWQAYWLIGAFPVRRNEAAAWLIIGVLVAVNAVFDYRRAARRAARREAPAPVTLHTALARSLKIAGVFTLVSLFWAWWSNPEVLKYLLYAVRLAGVQQRDVLCLGGTALAFLIVATAGQLALASRAPSRSHHPPGPRLEFSGPGFDRSVALHLLPTVLLLLISLKPVYSHFDVRLARSMANLQIERTTPGDAMAMIDGYYEQLNQPAMQASPFIGKVRQPSTNRFAGEFMSMTRPVNDIRAIELIPGWEGEFDGAKTTVNRWGMRDRARSLRKAAGTVRLAMVGSSIIMGLGVEDDLTFSRRLEEHLNAGDDLPADQYEVLNFGIGRVYAVERRAMIEHKVLQFDPDVILYCAHQDELFRVTSTLGNSYRAGRSFEDPVLDQIFREQGLRSDLSEYAMEAIMARITTPVLEVTYHRMAELCEAADVKLVFVYLPIPGEHQVPGNAATVIDMARTAGMETIDLTGWWGEHATEEVVGVVDKYHPRDLGTRLIAERLELQLRRRPDWLIPSNADETAAQARTD